VGGVLFLGYFLLKYGAYAGWCFVGLRLLDPADPNPRSRAAVLGAGRVALGLSLGLAIWALSTRFYATHPDKTLTYLAVYVPVRWFEWSLIASLVEKSALAFLVPRSGKSLVFRLGGIAVSCLADVPMLIDGLPVGRFLC
jgi:hypothetical protein